MSDEPKTHSRNFVRAAWSLINMQLIVSAGAVAVTTWAAFSVSRMVEERAPYEQAAATPAQAVPVEPPAQAAAPPADAPIEAPAAAEAPATDQTGIATPEPAKPAPCFAVKGQYVRVQANGGWCDTGIIVANNYLAISAQGRWSNKGPPQVGPEGIANFRYPGTIVASASLASLVGKVGKTEFAIGPQYSGQIQDQGTLLLSINDTPDSMGDNEGYVELNVSIK